MNDSNRNTILAVILSGVVLIAWQYFYNVPQMEKQRAAQQAQSELVKPATGAGSTATPSTATPAPQAGAINAPSPTTPAQPATAAAVIDREAAIAATPRVKIDTPRLIGSVSLKGRRIDALSR